VNNLQLQWAFQARSLEKFEATPLVVDGMMYLTQAPNDVVALDAATGEIKWLYSYSPSREARVCCGRVNRGLAILGNTLYMGTIDAHLVALNARTGVLVWDKEVAKPEAGYSITHAPLVVKDKVIVGTAGGEYGIRGFIAAFDGATGNEAWRFYTIPGKGEPGNETWTGDSWMHGGASEIRVRISTATSGLAITFIAIAWWRWMPIPARSNGISNSLRMMFGTTIRRRCRCWRI
jgi:alcohol dehydrogenase (cytochrome c)